MYVYDVFREVHLRVGGELFGNEIRRCYNIRKSFIVSYIRFRNFIAFR